MNRTTARRLRGIVSLAAAAAVTTGLGACTVAVDPAGSTETAVASVAADDASDPAPEAETDAAGAPRPTLTTDLRAGDCIGELASSGKADEVGVVDCDTPHAAQVAGTFTADGDGWPGKDALQSAALVGCPIAAADALGRRVQPPDPRATPAPGGRGRAIDALRRDASID
ncbi:MAG: hypothetical protein HGA44_10360 [Cellulomonadaceae bacterium]|nr:hypothetical protein [Cellulomonadaceae bacterium]